MYTGSDIDLGYLERDTGLPTEQIARYDNLSANCNDSDPDGTTTYHLSDSGTVDRSSGTGLTIDSNGEGYCKGAVFDDQQISIIAKAKIPVFDDAAEPFAHTIMARYDYPSGRNFAVVVGADASHNLCLGIGYNNGSNAEWTCHASTLSQDTYYWFGITLDGINKEVDLWVRNTSNTEIGADIDNQAVLSGREWNYTESQLLLGVYEESGVYKTGYHLDGLLDYAELREGIMTESDFETIVTAGSPATPSISSSDFCECDSPYASLSVDQQLIGPGEYYCWKAVGSEAIYPAAQGACADWTVSMNVGGNMDYYAGCESSTIVFRGQTTQAAQKLGELQPASSAPINENGTDVQDSEANSFDLTGINTSEYSTYIFNTSIRPRQQYSPNSPAYKHSSAGQPIGAD
jgi:hypothetical protein